MTSDYVAKAIEAGYAQCGRFAAVGVFSFQHRNGEYQQTNVVAGDRKVEICVSPTGRSVRIYVDGKEVA